MSFFAAIIAGVLVLGGLGYFLAKQYQGYQTKKVEQEKITQITAETQQKALEQARSEIEKLKIESEQSKNQQKAIEQKLNLETSKPNLSIFAAEINPLLSGIVQVICKESRGSGSLWKHSSSGAYALLTNKHIVETPFGNGYCFISVATTDNKAAGVYLVNTRNFQPWNYRTDVAVLELIPFTDASFFIKDLVVLERRLLDLSVPINLLNYKISTLPKCAANTKIGSNIVMVGYPAFTSQTTQESAGVKSTTDSRAVSNGIISAMDSSPLKVDLPHSDYYVSAKIDSGNSGGIAFSKDGNGLCVLGIPTWLTVGNYETQGIVQNIHNVLYEN